MSEIREYLRWLGKELVTLPRRLKTAWAYSKLVGKELKYIIKHPATEITIGALGITYSVVIILITTFYLSPRSCFVDGFYTSRIWSFISVVPSFFIMTHGIYRSEVDC